MVEPGWRIHGKERKYHYYVADGSRLCGMAYVFGSGHPLADVPPAKQCRGCARRLASRARKQARRHRAVQAAMDRGRFAARLVALGGEGEQ